MKAWDVIVFAAVGLSISQFVQGSQSFSEDHESSRTKRQSGRVWGNTDFFNEAGIPQFWNKYDSGPFGVVIRGWQFSRCASEQWTNYKVNVSELTIYPQYPEFPGPIFFNITLDIKGQLPRRRIEMETEIRHAVKTENGQKGWQVIPCHGWNILDGCEGVGSCRYCDILKKCKEAVRTGHKHAKDEKVLDVLKNPKKLCPPPKGTWNINFSQTFKTEDIPKGFFGPMQSNEYWMTFTFTDGRGTNLGCFRIWMDICKYHLYDRYKKCIRDPSAVNDFLKQISEDAKQLRRSG